MEAFTLAEDIYFELFLVGLLLFGIMFYNNIILYKLDIKDSISVMLIVGLVVHIIDYTWVRIDGKQDLIWINYALAFGYAICITMCVMALFRFTIESFDIHFRLQQSPYIIYSLPIIFTVVCGFISPWIHVLYFVDQYGYIQYMPIYDNVYIPLMVTYVAVSIIITIYHLINNDRRKAYKTRMAVHVLVFAVLVMFTYLLQSEVLDLDEQYMSLSLCWAVGLIYFTINANTDRMIENMNRIASVEADLNIAANIQLGSLPTIDHVLTKYNDIKVYATIDPAKEVGGDFYDLFEIDDHHIGFVVADVSGKGIPAALFMMTAKTMIKENALVKSSTADVFISVNKRLSENNETGMFATAWIGILDTDTKVMQYTNAGHNAPCVRIGDGGFKLLKKKHGLFLAGMDDTEYSKSELELKEGDRIFLYTDGLTEAHNTEGKLYGEDRMLKCLNSSLDLDDKELLLKLKEDVLDFSRGTEQFDDITMMIISIT